MILHFSHMGLTDGRTFMKTSEELRSDVGTGVPNATAKDSRTVRGAASRRRGVR